jgi:ankyrin repeat protein
MSYAKDQYGSVTLKRMQNLFGKDILKEKYLNTINITQDDFLNREAIDPGIMLHKLIDEGDEDGAIKLIEKQGKDFNVNYEFNMRLPIFSVVNSKMYKLFNVIINHPKFDPSFEDGFGDSLLQSLLYMYGSDDISASKEEEKNLKNMINAIVSCKNFDFNIKDINNDTAINITCEYPKMAWVTEELVKNKNVDINFKNDLGNSPLASAIRNNNVDAIKALGKRPDLVVDKEDKALAESSGIDLNKLIKPTEDIFSEMSVLEDAEKLLEFAMTGSF